MDKKLKLNNQTDEDSDLMRFGHTVTLSIKYIIKSKQATSSFIWWGSWDFRKLYNL